MIHEIYLYKLYPITGFFLIDAFTVCVSSILLL